jgi:hypothetical protein
VCAGVLLRLELKRKLRRVSTFENTQREMDIENVM